MKGWKQQLEAYGRIGLYVYFAIFAGTLVAFFAALKLGLQDSVPWLAEHAGEGATLAGAWLLTKLVQIPRIAATLAVTPVVARWTGRPAVAAEAAPVPVETEPAG